MQSQPAKYGGYFFKSILTAISSADIIISQHDITHYVISEYDIWRNSMPDNIALTEAVYYILLSLYQPRHGYGIMQFVMEQSKGRVVLAAGTLYGAINSLLEKGWIRPLPYEASARKKEYEITESGKSAVNTELNRLRELLENGLRITGGRV